MRKHPLIWLALVMVLACTAIGLNGHAWVAIVGDIAAVLIALGAKHLARGRKPAQRLSGTTSAASTRRTG